MSHARLSSGRARSKRATTTIEFEYLKNPKLDFEQAVYEVAVSSYLAGGGDGYALLKGNIIEHTLTGINTLIAIHFGLSISDLHWIVAGMLDADTIISYMGKMTPITVGLERRIVFVNGTFISPCNQMLEEGTSTSGVATSVPTVSMTVFLLLSLRAHY